VCRHTLRTVPQAETLASEGELASARRGERVAQLADLSIPLQGVAPYSTSRWVVTDTKACAVPTVRP
jgi:hypothetical protein